MRPKARHDLFGLSTPEVFPPVHHCTSRELLPHVFTLICRSPLSRAKVDGLVSVALSVIRRSEYLPVRKQDALRCPDFPPSS